MEFDIDMINRYSLSRHKHISQGKHFYFVFVCIFHFTPSPVAFACRPHLSPTSFVILLLRSSFSSNSLSFFYSPLVTLKFFFTFSARRPSRLGVMVSKLVVLDQLRLSLILLLIAKLPYTFWAIYFLQFLFRPSLSPVFFDIFSSLFFSSSLFNYSVFSFFFIQSSYYSFFFSNFSPFFNLLPIPFSPISCAIFTLPFSSSVLLFLLHFSSPFFFFLLFLHLSFFSSKFLFLPLFVAIFVLQPTLTYFSSFLHHSFVFHCSNLSFFFYNFLRNTFFINLLLFLTCFLF